MKIKTEIKKITSIMLCVVLVLAMTACQEKETAPKDSVVAIVNGQEIMDSDAESFSKVYLFFNYGYSIDQIDPMQADNFKYQTGSNILIDAALIKEFLGDTVVMTDEAKEEVATGIEYLRSSDAATTAEMDRLGITDEEITAFYEYMYYTNAFQAKVNEENPIDDAAAAQYFEEHQAEFVSPASISASHILIGTGEHTAGDKKVAEDVLERINNGEDFATLAAEFSIDPGSKDNGGDLGTITAGQTVEPFETAAFALKNGEVSGIVETEHGFHIIKATSDLTPEAQLTFEEAKAQVIMIMQNENQVKKLTELREAADIEFISAIDPASL